MNTPEQRTPIFGRIILGLLTAAVLLVVISVFVGLHKLPWLLSLYSAILLAPLLYCFCRRGAAVWRDGLRFAPKGQGWRLYGWTLLAFVTLVVLLYSLESWRGRRAYANLRREVESKGGSLELKAVIPPPVLDDQNFCAVPLLAAMLDYETTATPPIGAERLRWRNPAAQQRLQTLRLPPLKSDQPRGASPQRDRRGSWLHAEPIKLAAWQKTLASNTNFPAAHPPRDAAEDVLTALGKFERDLAELHAARPRPAARWAVHYQDGWFGMLGVDSRAEHLRNLASVLKLRAVAALAAGRSDAALQDVKLVWRLADSMKEEPYFFAQYLRNELLLLSLQPVWEGLASRRWSDGQLAEMQAYLDQYDAFGSWQTAVRGESYQFMNLCRQMEDIFSWKTIKSHSREMLPDGAIIAYGLMWLFYPNGWTYQDQVFLYRFQERGRAALAPSAPQAARTEMNWREMPVDPLFAVFVLPKLRQMFQEKDSFEFVRTSLQQARLACALERHRLALGDFPATLAALVPRFLDKPPQTLDGRGPLLSYRRTADGQFLLHPAGLTAVSEKFDKNNAVNQRFHRLGDTDGVWRYPAR